jgi:DNA-binding CsgD family transcriptional regulator
MGGGTRVSTNLVGRATVLARCRALHDVSVGAMLLGTAGVGKTRLLRELEAAWRADGVAVTFLVASASTQAVPFGALAPLLDEGADGRMPASDDLVGTATALREKVLSVDGPVLVIDDAHLLDSASAGLVHQLVLEGVMLFCSVRTGESPHVSLERLWRSGSLERVEIETLSATETGAVVADLLDGQVDSGTVADVFDRTRGNPLLVTELVRAARSLGVVRRVRGFWRAAGELPPIPNATALLAANLGRLSPEQLHGCRLVAAGDPLPVALALGLVSETVLEELEAAGVIASDAQRHVIRLAHPLFRDATLAELADDDRRAIYRELVDAARAAPAVELARAVHGEWLLNAGLLDDVSELVGLAELTHTSDPRLSERFRLVAVSKAHDVTDRLRIVNLLAHQHRLAEAEELLGVGDLAQLPPVQRLAALLSRCFLLVMPGHRPVEALAILDSLIAEVGPLPDLRAVRATALWKIGRVDDAIGAAREVFDDETAPVGARAHAGLTLSSSMVHSGDSRGGIATVPRLLPILRAATPVLPEGPQSLALVELSRISYVDADLEAGFAVGRAGHRDAMLRGDDGVRAQYGHLLAWLELLAGRADTARELLAETMASDGIWCQTMRPWFNGVYVESLILSGRRAEAHVALEELRALRIAPLYEINLRIAEAAVLAAGGDFRKAGRRLTEFAQRSHGPGDRLFAQTAVYNAVRYGDRAAATLLRTWVARPRTTLESIQRDHAQALLDRDPHLIVSVAAAMGRRGLHWYEQEALAQAITVGAAVGDEQLVAHSWSLLVARHADAPGLHSPIVESLARRLLTEREFEVTRAAAAGDSNQEIAARFGISLRTAQTHLSRAYSKLGATGRAELPSRLFTAPQRIDPGP